MTDNKKVWIPCEVKKGPFSDERTVKITSGESEAVAFVGTDFLREPVEGGHTFIKVDVVSESKDTIVAKIPGVSISNKSITINKSDMEE